MALKKIILAVLAFMLAIVLEAAPLDYGLSIVSYPSPAESYTGMALEAGRPIALKGKTLELSFDVYNRKDNVFGCVFRILTDKGENVDLMYTADLQDVRQPILVTGTDVHSLSTPIATDEWIHVSLSLNPKDGQLELDYGGEILRVRDAGTKGAQSFRIAFGLCPFAGYVLSDVASVDLRDIRISRGGKPYRHWELARHAGNNCYDSLSGAPASVKNPVWIIDNYVSFRPVFSHSFLDTPSVTFDDDATFYMSSPGEPIHVFHVDGREPEEIPIRGGQNPANYPNQLFYVAGGHNWLTGYNLDEDLFSIFDFNTRRWDNEVVPTRDHFYWNNTNAWEPRIHALYSFGGYGHYHFKNELVVSYLDDKDKEKGVQVTIDEITPRYGVTSYIVDSLLYVFGGRGNPSGKQELSPKNYYDLYTINTRTFEVNKLWDLGNSPYGDFISGENFVYNWSNGDFYLLSNLDGFTLLKLRPEAPGIEKMSLPIPPKRNAQYTYVNIWHSYSREKIYALILQSQVDKKTDVDVYEINYPPISVSEVLQEEKRAKESSLPQGLWWKLALAVLLLALFTGNVYLLLKLHNQKSMSLRGSSQEEEDIPHYYDFSRSSVIFFGGFHVTDRNGNDVTAQFTPTIKSLLVLLILYTERHGGIPSHKINSLLWSYKTDDTANNNRNVYMSKLRTLLEDVGDIRIKSSNKLWSIAFGEGAICDYLEAARLFREGSGEEDVDRMLELFLRGPILPNTELDWIDDFKSTFSSSAIDFLSRQLSRSDLSDRTLLKAADTILQHDFLNEDALKAKVRILVRQSKPGLAKAIYDNFCKEYRKSLGIDYGVSFKELIS